MVRIEEGKIIIEIHTSTPCEDFEILNNALVDCITCIDEKMVVVSSVMPVISLLKELQPTWEQIKLMHGLSK